MTKAESALRVWLKGYQAVSNSDLSGLWGLAYSGGADSTALVLAALRVFPPAQLVLLYLDHGLRSPEERHQEQVWVKSQASKWGLRLVVGRLHPFDLLEKRSQRRNRGLEFEARRARLHFLSSFQNRLGSSNPILVAHHLDDQAETQLLRLLRGRPPRGWSGLNPFSSRFGRPFLDLSRGELHEILRAHSQDSFEDSSNQNPRFLRNRFRQRLKPLLDEQFPDWKRSLGRWAAWSEFSSSPQAEYLALPGPETKGHPQLVWPERVWSQWSPAERLKALQISQQKFWPFLRSEPSFWEALSNLPPGASSGSRQTHFFRDKEECRWRLQVAQTGSLGYFIPITPEKAFSYQKHVFKLGREVQKGVEVSAPQGDVALCDFDSRGGFLFDAQGPLAQWGRQGWAWLRNSAPGQETWRLEGSLEDI